MRSLRAAAIIRAAVLACIAFASTTAPLPALADEFYRVKLTDIAIPDGASVGEVRRTFQPFPNWTLICDENLKARTKICNVTQTFVDAAGTTIFSWSLAATEGGKPVFILRAPASLGPNGSIAIQPVAAKPLAAKVQGCDARTCVAMLPLGPTLSQEIERSNLVTISYDADGPVSLSAPLNGLAKAIAAID